MAFLKKDKIEKRAFTGKIIKKDMIGSSVYVYTGTNNVCDQVRTIIKRNIDPDTKKPMEKINGRLIVDEDYFVVVYFQEIDISALAAGKEMYDSVELNGEYKFDLYVNKTKDLIYFTQIKLAVEAHNQEE